MFDARLADELRLNCVQSLKQLPPSNPFADKLERNRARLSFAAQCAALRRRRWRAARLKRMR